MSLTRKRVREILEMARHNKRTPAGDGLPTTGLVIFATSEEMTEIIKCADNWLREYVPDVYVDDDDLNSDLDEGRDETTAVNPPKPECCGGCSEPASSRALDWQWGGVWLCIDCFRKYKTRV